MTDTMRVIENKELRRLANHFMRMAEGKSDYYGKTYDLLTEAGTPPPPPPGADPMGGAGAPPPPPGADPNGAGAPPMPGADPNAAGAPPMPGADPNAAGAPPMLGADPMGGAGAPPMPGADPMGGGPSGGGPSDTTGDGVLDDLDGDGHTDDATGDGFPDLDNSPLGGTEEAPEGEKDDVITVDDLTDAQEKMNDKVNLVGQNLGKVDTKILDVLSSVDKLVSLIDKNNKEIDYLKREIEKRNPSPVEKLNLRSLDSYPFNVKISDYWKEKADSSHYQPYSDNNESTTAMPSEYAITKDDIENASDIDMDRSFEEDSDEDLYQPLSKIFGRNYVS